MLQLHVHVHVHQQHVHCASATAALHMLCCSSSLALWVGSSRLCSIVLLLLLHAVTDDPDGVSCAGCIHTPAHTLLSTTIHTNTFCSLYKYILQFRQVHLAILTNTFSASAVHPHPHSTLSLNASARPQRRALGRWVRASTDWQMYNSGEKLHSEKCKCTTVCNGEKLHSEKCKCTILTNTVWRKAPQCKAQLTVRLHLKPCSSEAP